MIFSSIMAGMTIGGALGCSVATIFGLSAEICTAVGTVTGAGMGFAVGIAGKEYCKDI